MVLLDVRAMRAVLFKLLKIYCLQIMAMVNQDQTDYLCVALYPIGE